jgi:phage terminase large subunit-like protein
VGSGGAFFDADAIRAAVTLPGDLDPGDADRWVAGLDPAFSSDPFGLALVGRDRRDRRRLLVGRVRAWEPPRRKAVSLDEGRRVEDTVLAEVATVLREFDARAVTDQFKSAGVVERLRRYGIQVRAVAMTAPTKDAAFGFLRGRLNEGSIELPDHPDLLRELRAVRTRYAAGRSSVVLPRIGGSHCDLAQALAVAVFEHDRHGIGGRKGRMYAPRPGRLVPAGLPELPALSGGDSFHELITARRR